MIFEIILQKGIEKINPFKTCLILRFDFHLQNVSFVKTVSPARKYDKVPQELFQIKFSYLIFIKIYLQLYKTTFLIDKFFKESCIFRKV